MESRGVGSRKENREWRMFGVSSDDAAVYAAQASSSPGAETLPIPDSRSRSAKSLPRTVNYYKELKLNAKSSMLRRLENACRNKTS